MVRSHIAAVPYLAYEQGLSALDTQVVFLLVITPSGLCVTTLFSLSEGKWSARGSVKCRIFRI